MNVIDHWAPPYYIQAAFDLSRSYLLTVNCRIVFPIYFIDQ